MGELLHIDYHLFMGWIQLILVLLGVYFIFMYIKQYYLYLPFVIMMGLSLLLIIGPVNFLPYSWLFEFWPYFDHLRVPFRMYPFFLMSLSIIACIPLLRLKRKLLVVSVLIFLITLLQILTSPWISNLHMYYL